MSDKVRIGLIGLGFMGTTHFRIYQDLPDAQVVAVADIDPERRKGNISTVWGNIGNADNSIPLDFSNIQTFADGLEMIRTMDLDMVDICIPTPWHKDMILGALAAKRHVFSEKPLCRNLQQMEEIIAAVKKSDRFFNIGLCIRAWPEYRHAREQFKAGKFGKLKCATFRRISPTADGGGAWNNWFCKFDICGGALLDMHMHDADAIRYFFGRPKAVTAFGGKALRSDASIDHVVANYDYGDNILICAEGGWGGAKTVPFEMSFLIICEKATLQLDNNGYKIHWENGTVEAPQVADAALPTGWHQELAYFVQCVKNGIKPDKYQTLDEITDSFRMVMAEQDSIDQKKTITVQY
ncbi:MAG: Gfo/Idh/MocA family oxidoreductase [Lentisphaeria bacterium]